MVKIVCMSDVPRDASRSNTTIYENALHGLYQAYRGPETTRHDYVTCSPPFLERYLIVQDERFRPNGIVTLATRYTSTGQHFTGTVMDLFVRQVVRRQGLGTALLRRVIDDAWRLGYISLECSVSPGLPDYLAVTRMLPRLNFRSISLANPAVGAAGVNLYELVLQRPVELR